MYPQLFQFATHRTHYHLLVTALYTGVCVLLSALSLQALAHPSVVSPIEITHAYAGATVATQSVGGVYFKNITNQGDTLDRLTSAKVARSIAKSTELHAMNTVNDIMQMRQVKAINLPAKTPIPMTRGLKTNGYHIMLMGLNKPLIAGHSFLLTLTFERAGNVDVWVKVADIAALNLAESLNVATTPTLNTHQH
jgi:periplasmic copper chaperone A